MGFFSESSTRRAFLAGAIAFAAFSTVFTSVARYLLKGEYWLAQHSLLISVLAFLAGYQLAGWASARKVARDKEGLKYHVWRMNDELVMVRGERNELLIEKEALLADLNTAYTLCRPDRESAAPAINSQVFARLKSAIDVFPAKYPDYQSRPPKLDDDVRAWLKDERFAQNDTEKRVFGAILAEHFEIGRHTT